MRRADTEGKALRFESGRISERPPKNAVQNLLAGLATSGVCGGGLVVETSGRKVGRVAEYVCTRHRHNGTCTNGLRMNLAEMNEAVLQAVEERALTPEAVEQVIAFTEPDDPRGRRRRGCVHRYPGRRAVGAVHADGATGTTVRESRAGFQGSQ